MLIFPLNLFSSLVLRFCCGRLLRNWWRKLSPRVLRWLTKQSRIVRVTCALHLRFVCLLVCFWLVGSSYVRMCMATFVFCLFLSILLCVSYRCISVHLFKISVTQICGHHGMFVYAQPSPASRTKKLTSSPSGSQYEDVVPMWRCDQL